MYRICEVDGQDDDIADTLTELHRLTFFDGACIPEFDRGIGGPRERAGRLRRRRSVNARLQCRIFLPGWRAERTLRQRASIAPDAGDGSAR